MFNRGAAVLQTGVATTTPARVYVLGSDGKETFARRVKFRNEDSVNNLLVSLGGPVFANIGPGAELEIDGISNQFILKSSAGTVNWSALMASAS